MGVKSRSKRASNRGRNGRQIEFETGVKLSSKRTSKPKSRPGGHVRPKMRARSASGASENLKVSANEPLRARMVAPGPPKCARSPEPPNTNFGIFEWMATDTKQLLNGCQVVENKIEVINLCLINVICMLIIPEALIYETFDGILSSMPSFSE